MRLESLKSPAFESIDPGKMAKILGGTPTAGYDVTLPGNVRIQVCIRLHRN